MKSIIDQFVLTGQRRARRQRQSHVEMFFQAVAVVVSVTATQSLEGVLMPACLKMFAMLAMGSVLMACAISRTPNSDIESQVWAILVFRAIVVGLAGLVLIEATLAILELLPDPDSVSLFEGLVDVDENALGLMMVGAVVAVSISRRLALALFGPIAVKGMTAKRRSFALLLWCFLGALVLVFPILGMLTLGVIIYRVQIVCTYGATKRWATLGSTRG